MTRRDLLRRSGIRRLGTAKDGFRYVRADGRPVSADDEERIRRLVLPPAWRDVAVAASPRARLQAVGRDAAGRWQYRYAASQERRRERDKLERLLRFAAALPRLRRRVARDLALPGLPRDRVLAAAARILDACALRPGSQEYADTHGSIGLATLRPEHVRVRGDRVAFAFPGKSGKAQATEVRDAALAAAVRACLAAPGRDVLKWVDASGAVVDVRRRHVNAYLSEAAGTPARAKDFRTWAGTLVCAQALARAAGDEDVRRLPWRRRRLLAGAVREAAALLGNTPAVCRRAYVVPRLVEAFARGALCDERLRGGRRARARKGMSVCERALLGVLRGRRGVRRPRRATGAPSPTRRSRRTRREPGPRGRASARGTAARGAGR